MSDSIDALLDIVHALAVTYQVPLTAETLRECRHIVDQTVGNFATQATDQNALAHPWEHEGFRTFILGEVAKIAAEVKQLPDQPASPDAFREIARRVMRRTNRRCRLHVAGGELTFGTHAVPAGFQGDVCSVYLNASSGPRPH